MMIWGSMSWFDASWIIRVTDGMNSGWLIGILTSCTVEEVVNMLFLNDINDVVFLQDNVPNINLGPRKTG